MEFQFIAHNYMVKFSEYLEIAEVIRAVRLSLSPVPQVLTEKLHPLAHA